MEDFQQVFPGESEMAQRMRAFDWAQTPLGSPEQWPNSLRTSIRLLLSPREPVFIERSEPSPAVTPIRKPRRARIVIADNNADLRLYLGSLIGREHDVTVVDDGEAALLAIHTHHPELVVADVKMPRLNGYELLTHLRADPSTAGVPVILLSTQGDEDARIEGIGRGADDYLVKPFSARELTARINTHVALSKARRSVERLLHQNNRELERKIQERSAALRESEERKAYLLGLSDALRPLKDSKAIQQEAARLLREKLRAGWCYYIEFNPGGMAVSVLQSSTHPGLPPLLVQDSRLPAEHIQAFRAGRIVVVSDLFSEETLSGAAINYYVIVGVRALLGVPLVKDGMLIAALIVADCTVRPWTDTSINLISETAERTWAAVERARAEAHQSVLLAEIQHRVRNIMALIRSVTLRTGQGVHSVAEYSEVLSGRLLSLARVQTLLSRAANSWISIADIVKDEVSGHDDQFQMAGPEVNLSPKATEVLTLVLHELVTNAVKHGALSVASGRIELNWHTFSRSGAFWLGLNWLETEGPAPQGAAVRRRGFGSELIEELVPYELGGTGRLTLAPSGAQCRLEFPLRGGNSILETEAPQKTHAL